MSPQHQIHNLADLATVSPRQPDADVYLTPQSVQAALSALRAHVDMLSAIEGDPSARLFRIEALDGSGAVQQELAVVNDRRLAQAAFNEAIKTQGRIVRLSQGTNEIAMSK